MMSDTSRRLAGCGFLGSSPRWSFSAETSTPVTLSSYLAPGIPSPPRDFPGSPLLEMLQYQAVLAGVFLPPDRWTVVIHKTHASHQTTA